MALQQVPPGRLAVAYYNNAEIKIGDATALTFTDWLALATTVVAGNVSDISRPANPTYANTNTRENTADGYASQKPVLKGGEVTFESLWHTKILQADQDKSLEQFLVDRDDDFSEMTMAFFDYDAKTIATGDIVQGVAGNYTVSVERQEAIEDVQRLAVTLTASTKVAYQKITGTP